MMKKDSRIWVAGHRGMVGSAIVRKLREMGYSNLILVTREQVDLLNQQQVYDFYERYQPEYVFVAAAKVGGIWANSNFPGDFIYQNIQIAVNVIEGARRYGVKKLLFLGSSCIYPRHAPQPIKEEYLLSGYLEPTNEWYAIAKIAGIKMCQAYRRQYGCDFISAQPTNLYGPGDNYDLMSSHVVAALLRKFHEAKIKGEKKVVVWGTGTPRREFLYVDDLADALIFLMNNYSDEVPVNIGTGEDISIKELAFLIKEITGYDGDIIFDTGMPDGMPRKLLDVSRIHALGWRHKTTLRDGLTMTYLHHFPHDILKYMEKPVKQ